MSARLTVIICQSTVRAGLAADLEETLVAELMMAPGFDATMIGPLEAVEPGGTDLLCLSSFNHSLALLTWLPSEEAQRHWSRLGLEGQVTTLNKAGEGAADAPEKAASRKVFHIQLSEGMGAKTALSQLQQLLASRQVKTVGISGIGIAPKPPKRESPPKLTTQAKADSSTDSKVAASISSGKVEPGAVQAGIDPTGQSLEDQEWEHLDKLVDDFEELDL